MPMTSIAGRTLDVDADGYLTNPDQWDREVAAALAADVGIPALTDQHWKVIEFCRKDAKEKGEAPGLRRIAAASGVGMKDLYALFPKGPGKLAAYVSGLPKPKGCV